MPNIQTVFEVMRETVSSETRPQLDQYWSLYLEKYWPEYHLYRGSGVDDIPAEVFVVYLAVASVASGREDTPYAKTIKMLVEARERAKSTAAKWVGKDKLSAETIHELNEGLKAAIDRFGHEPELWYLYFLIESLST